MRRCLVVLAAALLSAAALTPAARAATATPLTTVADDTPIAAYGGWVAWSEKGADGLYRIVTFHDGVKQTLSAVAPRTVPFDLDVGPGALDRPEVVFSRCAVERDVTRLDAPLSAARGCRLRTASLPGGGEAGLPVPGRGSASDATPSLWGYRVAFQRRARGSDVSQVKLYDFQRKRMRTLPHGAVPHACPFRGGCPNARYMGEVDELDLNAREVAYSWRLVAPSVIGAGGAAWELRVAPTIGAGSVLAGSGYVSGACGGRGVFSPQAVPGGVLFLSRQYFCENVVGTVTATTLESRGLLAQTTDAGGTAPAWRVLRDAADGTTYAVLGPSRRSTQTSLPADALTLARIDGLAPKATKKRAGEPFLTGS